MSLPQSSIDKPVVVKANRFTRPRLSSKATLIAKNKWRRLSRFFKSKRDESQDEDAEHDRTGCAGGGAFDCRSDQEDYDVMPVSPADSTSGIWRGLSQRQRIRESGADFDMVSTTSTNSSQTGEVYRLPDGSVRVEGVDFDIVSTSSTNPPQTGEVYRSPDGLVRVEGVDFEIVSIPSSTRSGRSETPQNQDNFRSETPSSLEFEDYSAYYAMPSPLRHRFSTQSVIDDCCNYVPCDSLERQALRRRLSLQTQFRQFQDTWARSFQPLVRPGSIYEQMMEVDREITDLVKERIFYLNPGGPFVSKQTFNSEFMELLETTAREQSEVEPSPQRIKRKPVPPF